MNRENPAQRSGVPPTGDALEGAIQARAEAATPGPWISAEQSDATWFGIQSEHFALGLAFNSSDAEFIAHARTDIPALLGALATERKRAAHWEMRARRRLNTMDRLQTELDAQKPCRGENSNICAAEGCYAEACIAPEPGWALRLHEGVCPKCRERKFIGHGPLCPDCYLAGDA